MIAIIAFALSQSAQPANLDSLTQAISFHGPAAPLSRLLPEIGKAVGVDLGATVSTAADVAVLDCEEKPLNAVLAKLAVVDSAEWQTIQGKLRLVRTDKLARTEEDRERNERALDIKEAIDALQVNAASPFDAHGSDQLATKLADQAARGQRDQNPYRVGAVDAYRSPIQRALIRTLALVDAKDVAMLAQGDTLAYSTKPNRLQFPLPSGEAAVLATLAKEQAIWADSVSKLRIPTTTGPRFAADPLNQSEPFATPPVRAVLVARRGNSMSPVVYDYYAIDADGRELGMAQVWLTPKTVQKQRAQFDAPTAPKDDPALPLTVDSQAYVDAFKSVVTRSLQADLNLTDRQRTLLTHPDAIEPLGLASYDGLLAVARTKNKAVIGIVPDDMLICALMMSASRTTLTSFVTASTTIGQTDIADVGDWIVVSPQRPSSCRRERISRPALARYLQSIVKIGYSTLDEESRYALGARDADYDILGMVMGTLFDAYQTQNIDKDWPTLRLYATLTQIQKTALASGKALSYLELSPDQQSIVARKLLTQRATQWRSSESESRGDIGSPGRYRTEPTEILSDGLTASVLVTMKVVSEPIAIASLASGKFNRVGYMRIYNAASLAHVISQRRQPAESDTSGAPAWDLFQMGRQASYSFEFAYSPFASISTQIFDRAPDPNSKPLAFEQLPETFRLAVEAAEKAGGSVQSAGIVKKQPVHRLR